MSRPSTFDPLSMAIKTSTNTTDVQTAASPATASACLLSAETNDARVTFDGSDPSAGTGSHKIPKDQAPVLLLVGSGATIKLVSTTAASSILQITWLG